MQLPSGTYTLTVERHHGAAGGEWSAWAGAAGTVTVRRDAAREAAYGSASGSFSAAGGSDRLGEVQINWNHLGEVTSPR